MRVLMLSERIFVDCVVYLNLIHFLIFFTYFLQKDTGIIALKEISDVLKEKNDHGASAFEILHSGLIKSLLK